MKRIYLDYAATTPVRGEAHEAMLAYLGEKFGNPGSLHSFGQEAVAALDQSREIFSKLLNTDFRSIIFTSSATEANNLALRGAVAVWKESHPGKVPRVITSSLEHESVLETVKQLAGDGMEAVCIRADKDGLVNGDDLPAAINERTVLVSIMYVNNEIGTAQDLSAISKIIEGKKKEFGGKFPLFHTDAAQAWSYLDSRPDALGVDMLTLSSHKMCGPKGAALLYVKDKASLAPIIWGGGQEFSLRSGTENVPAIVGFAEAAALADKERADLRGDVQVLARAFFEKVKAVFPAVRVNGPEIGAKHRSPHILNLRFPGRSAEEMLTELDLKGVAAASGSACSSRAGRPSQVLRAIGLNDAAAKESIRFSFGLGLDEKDVDACSIILGEILAKHA